MPFYSNEGCLWLRQSLAQPMEAAGTREAGEAAHALAGVACMDSLHFSGFCMGPGTGSEGCPGGPMNGGIIEGRRVFCLALPPWFFNGVHCRAGRIRL